MAANLWTKLIGLSHKPVGTFGLLFETALTVAMATGVV